ncbi:hypothetical protein QKW52_02660 [Bacillus sonorensis]|nr:hypothetical protein [Bacillus sonorensis]
MSARSHSRLVCRPENDGSSFARVSSHSFIARFIGKLAVGEIKKQRFLKQAQLNLLAFAGSLRSQFLYIKQRRL